MNVLILTGNETRHKYFRTKMALDKRINVLSSYCEGVEKSLQTRTESNPEASIIELMHVDARTQAEDDFFGISLKAMKDLSNSKVIKKGEINNPQIVEEITSLDADVIVCYGSSLIKSELLEIYKDKFLNVHLGLSPYYRGSGTNVWPLINEEPDMVGATFMFIDSGIDTGEIIHQVRADIFLGDSPHSIGNRLIAKMTDVYCDIVANFEHLTREAQPISDGKLYYKKDFNKNACEKLYKNFSNCMIRDFIEQVDVEKLPYIVENKGLSLNR